MREDWISFGSLAQEMKQTIDDAGASVPFPASFRCPITYEVMEDAVQTSDGHVYERKAITEWFKRGNVTSPLTGLQLSDLTLRPLESLQRAIEDYKLAFPQAVQKLTLQKAEEEIQANARRQRDALSRLTFKQRYAWYELILTAVKNGHDYVLRGLYDTDAYGVTATLARHDFQFSVAAMMSGHNHMLETLAEVGVPLDEKDVDGSTLAHFAARLGNAETIDVLKRFGAPFEKENDTGITPLQTALLSGNLLVVKRLQHYGAMDGAALLHASQNEGNIELIKELSVSGLHTDSDEEPVVSRAIGRAACLGHTGNLESLLPLAQSREHLWLKWSSMWPFQAIWSGNAPAVLELLHRFGVALDAIDSKFEVFPRRDVREAWSKQHQMYKQFWPSWMQQAESQTATLEELGKSWRSIGTWGCEGQTPAHWAAMVGNEKAIQTLHNFNVSMTCEDTAGCTPAHFAALMGHDGVLQLLHNLNVPLDIIDYRGRDPADYAKHMDREATNTKLQLFAMSLSIGDE